MCSFCCKTARYCTWRVLGGRWSGGDRDGEESNCDAKPTEGTHSLWQEEILSGGGVGANCPAWRPLWLPSWRGVYGGASLRGVLRCIWEWPDCARGPAWRPFAAAPVARARRRVRWHGATWPQLEVTRWVFEGTTSVCRRVHGLPRAGWREQPHLGGLNQAGLQQPRWARMAVPPAGCLPRRPRPRRRPPGAGLRRVRRALQA